MLICQAHLFLSVADWRWGFLVPGQDEPLGEAGSLSVQQGIRTFQAALSRLGDQDALPRSGISVSGYCSNVHSTPLVRDPPRLSPSRHLSQWYL